MPAGSASTAGWWSTRRADLRSGDHQRRRTTWSASASDRRTVASASLSLVDQTKVVTAASELARNTLHLRRRRLGPCSRS